VGLRRGSPLACSINIKGGARGTHMPTRHHMKTLATTSFSRPNSKALAAREVDSMEAFHPYTCGLHGDTVVAVAALIGYDDVEVAAGTTTRRRRPKSTTFSTPMHDYIGSLLQLCFCCSAHIVVTIHDFLLASILR
jgi:hypothetical protein